MKRNVITIALLLALFSVPLFAQEELEEEPIVISADDELLYEMNQKGNHYLGLKLDVNIPYRPFGNLQVGGSGSIGYHYFILDNFTIGGNISFSYTTTIGDNVYYFVPFMFAVGYQFDAGRWEFPISLEIGGAIQNYVDRTYFGLAIRPEMGAFYRYNADWSFGIQTGLYVLPQWYSNPEYNFTGLIHDVGLSVRYHF